MASEQVRLASKALGPLVRRHGTSPALKVTLREALKTLARALAETDTKTQAETIRQAIDELRFGLKLIQNSQRPADHAQLEGTAEALSFLAPLEGTVAREPAQILAPAPLPLPASASRSVRRHIPILRRRQHQRVFPGPRLPKQKTRHGRFCRNLSISRQIRLRLVGLLNRFNALHVALTEPLATLRDLDVACAELDKIVQAVKWLGVKGVPAFLKASEKRRDGGGPLGSQRGAHSPRRAG
jgi:hypothetical protein